MYCPLVTVFAFILFAAFAVSVPVTGVGNKTRDARSAVNEIQHAHNAPFINAIDRHALVIYGK
jgi:hypothetical protein